MTRCPPAPFVWALRRLLPAALALASGAAAAQATPPALPTAEQTDPARLGWSYRNMWWVSHNEHGAYHALARHLMANPR